MPLIVIRRKPSRVTNGIMRQIVRDLPAIAAKALSCEEGGHLEAKDIMIEVSDASAFDTNIKDFNMRVLAQDYLERHTNIEGIQKGLSKWVAKHLPGHLSWYVWVFLGTTSYGSDTMS